MEASALKRVDELSNEQLHEASKELCRLGEEYPANKPHIRLMILALVDLILEEMLVRAVGDREVAVRMHRERQGN